MFFIFKLFKFMTAKFHLLLLWAEFVNIGKQTNLSLCDPTSNLCEGYVIGLLLPTFIIVISVQLNYLRRFTSSLGICLDKSNMKRSNTPSNLSSSPTRTKDDVDRPICYDNMSSKLRVYGKTTSFGRQFYNSPNYKINKKCAFFERIGLEMVQNSCCKILWSWLNEGAIELILST